MGIFGKLFGGKQNPELSYAPLHCDIHSHLIPGIDDGAQTIEDSLEMVRALHDLGYRKCITTPHVMSDSYRNTPEIILGGLKKLQNAVAEAGIDMLIEAAAEYYIDEIFAKNLETAELLSFGGEKKYILFETSYVEAPMAVSSVIFRMQSMGYQPVLAHPERYQYYWVEEGMDEIRALNDRGVMLQVNLSSFAGRHSRNASSIARKLANEGRISFVGTDIHRARQAETMRKALSMSKELATLVASGNLLNSTL